MIDMRTRSPLEAPGMREFATAGFSMRELPHVAKARVQALRSRGLASAAADEQRLPATPGASLGLDPCALWKAPDDWFVYSFTLPAQPLCHLLSTVASSAPLIVTDVSCASVVLELSGPRAVDILMRDCTLDLEGNAIPPGHATQTALAQVGVFIHRPALHAPSDREVWRLFTERSVAPHLWAWFVDTAGPA